MLSSSTPKINHALSQGSKKPPHPDEEHVVVVFHGDASDIKIEIKSQYSEQLPPNDHKKSTDFVTFLKNNPGVSGHIAEFLTPDSLENLKHSSKQIFGKTNFSYGLKWAADSAKYVCSLLTCGYGGDVFCPNECLIMTPFKIAYGLIACTVTSLSSGCCFFAGGIKDCFTCYGEKNLHPVNLERPRR